jgi:hypothetical protein
MWTEPSSQVRTVTLLPARGEGFSKQLYAGTERAELFGLCDIDEDRIRKFCDYCGIQNARTWSDPK